MVAHPEVAVESEGDDGDGEADEQPCLDTVAGESDASANVPRGTGDEFKLKQSRGAD